MTMTTTMITTVIMTSTITMSRIQKWMPKCPPLIMIMRTSLHWLKLRLQQLKRSLMRHMTMMKTTMIMIVIMTTTMIMMTMTIITTKTKKRTVFSV